MQDIRLTYDTFDPDAEGLREALTSTGNGYFCTRGTAEWEDMGPVHYPGTYAHGGGGTHRHDALGTGHVLASHDYSLPRSSDTLL